MDSYILFIQIFIVISVIWLILNVILFFKIWGMTNNIKLALAVYMDDKDITVLEVDYGNNGVLKKQYLNKDGKHIYSE
jgi:hypothetical protein